MNSQPTIKTRILNGFRNIGKLRFLEQILAAKTQGKNNENFFAKLLPNNYQYSPKTMRQCRRDGIAYNLDISDYMQYCIYYGIQTEPRDRLYNLVRNGSTVIDVGTNIGETLLNFAKLNPSGKNIGFEPVPFLYDHALEHIRLNDFSNIVLENLALADKSGTLTFNYSVENNSGGIYLSTEATGENSSRMVIAERLDSYLSGSEIKDISLIKIDVEGFEMNVLKGAIQTLKKYQPALFLEINDKFLKRQNSSARELFDFLLTLNYSINYAETMQPLSVTDDFENKHFDVVCVI